LTDAGRLETSALALGYGIVPWDTEIFGFPVAQLHDVEVKDAAAAAIPFAAFESWRDRRGVRLVSARLDRSNPAAWMFLESRGFRFIEMTYHPVCSDLASLPLTPNEIEIGAPRPGDEVVLEAIARAAFSTGRFALDPRLSPELSGKRYAAWTRSALTHPAQRVVLFRRAGEVVAFFVLERSGDTVRWHLTAVAPAWQGRGIGTRVWNAMLLAHRAEGVRRVETVISAHNLRVLGLYGRLGFSMSRAEVTFHWVGGSQGTASGTTS